MDLRQPGFTSSSCEPFTKNKEKIQKKFKETVDSKYFYQNKLEKASLHHDAAYEEFKCLPKRKASDKTFLDKAFNIAKIQNKMDINANLLKMVYNFFLIKSLLVLIFQLVILHVQMNLQLKVIFCQTIVVQT